MPVTINDLKIGDEIEITRRVKISTVDTYDGVVYEKGNGTKVRLVKPDYSYSNKPPVVFTFTRVKEADKTIEHWPPQKGDVWELDGAQYHALASSYGSGEASFYNTSGFSYTLANMKKPGIKLVYRAGNSLK